MGIKKTLVSLVLLLSVQAHNAENQSMFHDALENLRKLSIVNFYNFNMDFRKRTIRYLEYPNLYFSIGRDHNGKPLYRLNLDFNIKDVQEYFKKLQ